MAKNSYTDLFKEADAAFNGIYKSELNDLYGLSREEIDALVPGTTDLQTYSVLCKVVEQASRENLSQAQLIDKIKDLGDIAVKIAKKVPALAKLFL